MSPSFNVKYGLADLARVTFVRLTMGNILPKFCLNLGGNLVDYSVTVNLVMYITVYLSIINPPLSHH